METSDAPDRGDRADGLEDVGRDDPDLTPDDIGPDEDASDPEPLGCIQPIRDCGPGCRQVTCAGIVYQSNAWDVSGPIVAYYTGVGGNTNGMGLYIKNLDTGTEIKAKGYPDAWFQSMYVAAFQNLILYELFGGGSSCMESLIVFDAMSSVDYPAICYPVNTVDETTGAIEYVDVNGNTAVWHGHDENEPSSVSDLFSYDLTSMMMTRLTYHEGINWEPKIWGRQIAYTKWWDNFEIFLWDLDTSTARNLTENPSDQFSPDIWQNRVVWVDHRNAPGDYYNLSNTDIYWCELPDCIAEPATVNWAAQDHATIEGDWIVWNDFRNDPLPLNPNFSPYHDQIEVWGYNISTDQEYQLVSFEHTLMGPKLRIENGKFYYIMAVDPNCLYDCGSAVFELDLSQFL